MEKKPRKRFFEQLNDYEEGSGNIWGWKFTNIGLVFMSALILIAVYRHWKMDVPFGYQPPEDENTHPFQQTSDPDTTKLEQ